MTKARDDKSVVSNSDSWYFAYGSNLSTSIFTGKRGIKPKDIKVAFLPKYELCFNVLFMPYTEPAMAGLRKRSCDNLPVYGVQYLLSQEDFRKLVVSEGGGVAYRVIQAESNIPSEAKAYDVYTLITRRDLSFSNERSPSERYMGLLIQGAQEQKLPHFYQEQLKGHPVFRISNSMRWHIGSWLFNITWQNVSMWVQRGIRKYKDENGNVPAWFLLIFDFLLWSMWVHHDCILAPIFGKGDGR